MEGFSEEAVEPFVPKGREALSVSHFKLRFGMGFNYIVRG